MDALAHAAAASSSPGNPANKKKWTADEERKLITHMGGVFEPDFDLNQILPLLSERSLGEIKDKWVSISSSLLKNLPKGDDRSQPQEKSQSQPPPERSHSTSSSVSSLPPPPPPPVHQPPPPVVHTKTVTANGEETYEVRTGKRKYPDGLCVLPVPIHAPQTKKQGKKGRPSKNTSSVEKGPTWGKEEAARLVKLLEKYQDGKSPQWDEIASNFTGRTAVDCLTQWHKMIPPDRARGKGSWTAEEDALLISKHALFGRKWSRISQFLPGRAGKQCRERYVNHLDPNLKKGAEWTDDEEAILIALHKNHGNKWTLISNQLSGRSDNDVKNHFNSTISRKFQVHGRDRLVEAAIQQVEMLIKAGMCPSDLLTRPCFPMRTEVDAPIVSSKKRSEDLPPDGLVTTDEPPRRKKVNYAPQHIHQSSHGYDYEYNNNFSYPSAPPPGYHHPHMVPYPYQYPNAPNPAPTSYGETLPSGVTASAETASTEDASSVDAAEDEDSSAPVISAPTRAIEQEQGS